MWKHALDFMQASNEMNVHASIFPNMNMRLKYQISLSYDIIVENLSFLHRAATYSWSKNFLKSLYIPVHLRERREEEREAAKCSHG